ncbi:unnamed protein product [Rangifer tarandus platyrhynchus]|uniref:Uncharacterized protein n=1 Tax=Rangifer tarandus platyrhynchus TaxID=3082113 RepID=A0AC60A4S0_RANTA
MRDGEGPRTPAGSGLVTAVPPTGPAVCQAEERKPETLGQEEGSPGGSGEGAGNGAPGPGDPSGLIFPKAVGGLASGGRLRPLPGEGCRPREPAPGALELMLQLLLRPNPRGPVASESPGSPPGSCTRCPHPLALTWALRGAINEPAPPGDQLPCVLVSEAASSSQEEKLQQPDLAWKKEEASAGPAAREARRSRVGSPGVPAKAPATDSDPGELRGQCELTPQVCEVQIMS